MAFPHNGHAGRPGGLPSALLAVWLGLPLSLVLGACPKRDGAPSPVKLREDDRSGLVVDKVRLLGTVEIPGTTPSGKELHELSGLAWDEAAGLLYAVSDRGWLHHLLPVFDGDSLVSVSVVNTVQLHDKRGPLTGGRKDAEGLHLRKPSSPGGSSAAGGGAQLVISFEKEPRVRRFNAKGQASSGRLEAKSIAEVARYDSDNHALEAVTALPGVGLIVAPERSIPGWPPGVIPLWNAQTGRDLGTFTGLGKKRSAVVALEGLPDGRLLVLERHFKSEDRRLRSALYLASPPVPPAAVPPTPVPDAGRRESARKPEPPAAWAVQRLVRLDTAEGWRHDNYEGMTLHRGARLFLVSDDNGGAPQRTLLTYLEVLPLVASAGEPP